MTIGAHRHLVLLQNPGPAVPDGDGNFTQPWEDLSPSTWYCAITPATARDLERVAAGTVLSTGMSIVTGRHHPGITTQTRLVFNGRTLAVTGVGNPEERNIQTIAVCVEIVA